MNYKLFGYLLVDRRRIRKIVSEFNPDIIHSNNSCFTLGLEIANDLNIPHIQHIREYGKLDIGKSYFPTKNNYVQSISKKNDLVLCITNDIKRYFLSDKKYRNWHVVYDGVINGKNIFIPIKEPYFLYVGRLFPGKCVFELINQFAVFVQNTSSNIRLKIVGDGTNEYKEKLVKCVLENKIVDKVDFLGYSSDVYSIMSKALALFVPSSFEGFGFITVEAMFCGCLVIGRNTGGTKEQFDNGLTLEGDEIAIRFDNDEDLASIMENISMNGVESYYSMIKRSQKVVMQCYTIDISADVVYGLYENMLKNKSEK